ncbi:MAG TPA: cation-transporting P-type ATPase [Acidimicrobiales bacterium]|nr:cation-transporting P-type ATPase [Acidimicrobiales bacterium]
MTEGRAHLEVRGAQQAGHEQLAKDLETALCEVEGVLWAQVNGTVGRVVVAYDPPGPALEELVGVVEAVEAGYDLDGDRLPPDRPEHPADIEPLRRAAVALGADVAGLWVSVFGQLLRATPVPVELAALLSLADQQPRARAFVERLVGAPGADLGLGVASALAQAVAQGPLGLVVDIGHRVHQVSELQARRAAWERLEPGLCATPAVLAPPAVGAGRQSGPLRGGPVERYADRATLASLGAGGAALALTGNPRRSAGLLVAGLPKASRMGRETFAAVVGRELARRDVLVMDHTALRRLDRIDVAVLDVRALLGPPMLGAIETFGVPEDEVRAVLAELFDPTGSRPVARHGQWMIAPFPVLRRLGIAVPSRVTAPPGSPEGAAGLLGVARAGVVVASVALDTAVDPLAQPLAATVRQAGLELALAGGSRWQAEQFQVDRSVPGGARLARSVRTMQAGGRGVLLVSVGSAHEALAAADLSVGIRAPHAVVPWGADLLSPEGLVDAHLIVEATVAARRVSTLSAQLALTGSGVGGLSAILGPAYGASRRAALAVNGAALAAQIQALISARALTGRSRPIPEVSRPWHDMGVTEVLTTLGTDPAGLRPDQVRERWVAPPRTAPTLIRLSRAVGAELTNPLTPVLGLGAALAAAVGSVTDAGLVAGVVGANALIGGVQRLRAEVSIERLIEVSNTPVAVQRSGGPGLVGSDELVMGDLVELVAGQVVPADCRVLDAEGCEVDESVLTGESLPVVKEPATTPGVDVADRSCMLYEGTTISSGRTRAVVVALGSGTEAGRSLAEAPEPPPSGVESRLSSLTALTLPITVASGAAVAGIGLARARSPRQAIVSGVSLMVAAVPEGLPLLASVAQLAAARRLSSRGALVRHPRTIEALGRVDTLCFDKTGTLTMGEIRLQRISDGDVDEPIAALGPRSRTVLAAALRASPDSDGDAIDRLLHATDRSVLVGARAVGVTAADGLGDWEALGELAFDSARGFHAAVGNSPGGARVAVKGAPEVVLPRCTSWCGPDGSQCLSDSVRHQLEQVVERMAGRGLRVLAVAERQSSERAEVADERVANLELLGFLGLADSVRPTAAAAVADLRAAGINVAMITGDHPSTARAIGDELGMVNGHRVISGREIDRLSDDELDAALPQVSIFARVTPAHKVRIVRGYQRIGRVVAMTGDGANDAPAIRLAHAGIALGDRGSPAAREAADIVVVDDRIETILACIVEGRAMWTSVRDALAILIGGNLGEVGFTVAASALTGTSPLRARQFLLVNLLTDMLPAMTIALRPPTNRPAATLLHEGPDASLGSSLTRQIALRATTTAAGALGAWVLARATGSTGRANTVALVALVGTQLGQTAAVGGHSPLVLASTLASGAALAVIVQTPGVSHFFGCRPLGPVGWGIAAGASGLATAGAVVATWATGHSQ